MKLSRKKREHILRVIASTGSAIQAAKQQGCSFQAVYQLRQRDDEFARGFELAMAEYQVKLEEECDRRAYEGTNHPVIHQGEITDTYKTYSDTLLMFRLKKLDPSYRDSTKIELTGKDRGPIETKNDNFDIDAYTKLFTATVAGAFGTDGIQKQVDTPYADSAAGSVPESPAA